MYNLRIIVCIIVRIMVRIIVHIIFAVYFSGGTKIFTTENKKILQRNALNLSWGVAILSSFPK